MIKLFVVDDEVMAINYFKSLIERMTFEAECVEVDSALDSLSALELISNMQPDIVFVDVNMPIMNGLELAQRVAERTKGVKIVLLTSYRDFDYIKQGMELGVHSYILKNELTVQNLRSVILKIMKSKRLEEEQEDAWLEIYLRKYLEDNILDEQWQKYFGGKNYALIYLSLHEGFCPGDKKEEIEENLQKKWILTCLEPWKGICRVLKYKKAAVILLAAERLNNAEVIKILEKLSMEAEKMTIPILGTYTEITDDFKDFPKLYREVRKIENQKLFFGKYARIAPKDLITPCEGKWERVWDETELWDALETENRIKETKIIKDRITALKKSQDDFVYQNGIKELLKVYRRFQKQKGISMDPKIWMTTLYSTEEVELWFSQFIILNHKLVLKNENSAYSRTTTRVLAYIEAHYHENISITEIADNIGISEGHLRRVFKEEMQLSPGDYLIHYRIKRAKELMKKKTLKISQIYEKVGFTSSQYFSSVFKKIEGVTPKEYQKRLDSSFRKEKR